MLLGLMLAGSFMVVGHVMKKSVEYYKQATPEMNFKDYFNGPVKAWGIVQDWRGRVVSQFDIHMVGEWKEDAGTLTEHFNYYDGKTQERIWTIKKLDDGKYEGTAADIIDKAFGCTKGNAAQWSYVMDLKVDSATYRIRFDDWMWAMNDGVLINRSYLKKFGFTVAELTIFMKKQ